MGETLSGTAGQDSGWRFVPSSKKATHDFAEKEATHFKAHHSSGEPIDSKGLFQAKPHTLLGAPPHFSLDEG